MVVICTLGVSSSPTPAMTSDSRCSPCRTRSERSWGCSPSRHAGGRETISFPDVVTEPDYDLVCIGAPTWWLSTNVPIRSFLESETASRVLKGKRFAAAVCCRRYWKHNLKTIRRLGATRRVRRRHPIPIRGGSGSLVPVVDRLPRLGGIPREVPGREDPTHQPAGSPPRAGEGLRGKARRWALLYGCGEGGIMSGLGSSITVALDPGPGRTGRHGRLTLDTLAPPRLGRPG